MSGMRKGGDAKKYKSAYASAVEEQAELEIPIS